MLWEEQHRRALEQAPAGSALLCGGADPYSGAQRVHGMRWRRRWDAAPWALERAHAKHS